MNVPARKFARASAAFNRKSSLTGRNPPRRNNADARGRAARCFCARNSRKKSHPRARRGKMLFLRKTKIQRRIHSHEDRRCVKKAVIIKDRSARIYPALKRRRARMYKSAFRFEFKWKRLCECTRARNRQKKKKGTRQNEFLVKQVLPLSNADDNKKEK